MSDNKLSDNNLASEFVGNHEESFKLISMEEIVIFMIILVEAEILGLSEFIIVSELLTLSVLRGSPLTSKIVWR